MRVAELEKQRRQWVEVLNRARLQRDHETVEHVKERIEIIDDELATLLPQEPKTDG